MTPWLTLKRQWRKLVGPARLEDFGDYDDYWDRRPIIHHKDRWEVAARHIRDEDSVHDVGAGPGGFLRYMKANRPAVEISGSELSEGAVLRARQDGFAVEQADLLADGVPGVFDVVTALEVLEHIPEAELALERLRHSFRRLLIVSVPNLGYIGFRLRLMFVGKFPITNCVGHMKEHVRHWTVRDFREWADHYGFRVVSVEGHKGPWHHLWRRFPTLWAEGVVYTLERKPAGPVAAARGPSPGRQPRA